MNVMRRKGGAYRTGVVGAFVFVQNALSLTLNLFTNVWDYVSMSEEMVCALSR